jgi:hypothetical protein
LPDRLDVAAAGEKGINDIGVPLSVAPVLENLVNLREAQAPAIRAIAGHRVERVGDRQDSSLKRYVFARKVVRVSCSIEALVVVLDTRKNMVQFFEVLENLDADFHM